MATILVVDDEPDIRFLLKVILEGAGHDVLQAHHGRRALEMIREELPDAVVTDWVMPRMTGPELIEELRAAPATSSLRILLVTSQLESVAGVDAFIRKPLDPDELLDTIERLLQGVRE